MWIFAVLFAWPLVEIGLFVTLGAKLGLWLTLGVVLATAALGVSLLRGRGAMLAGMGGGLRDPLVLMADGSLVMLAAILLILPGFLTDGIGLLLLLPPVRRAVITLLRRRIGLATGRHGAQSRGDAPEIIDAEFYDVTEPDNTRLPPDRRTRH